MPPLRARVPHRRRLCNRCQSRPGAAARLREDRQLSGISISVDEFFPFQSMSDVEILGLFEDSSIRLAARADKQKALIQGIRFMELMKMQNFL